MKRGEVWWAELPPPVGPRPVVILTRDRVLPSIDSVVVALVTRTVRGVETEVRVGRREGLPSQSVINLDNLLTVSEAVTRSALDRKESRGAQFRDDFPDKDPAFGQVNTVVWKGADGAMQLRREPIPPMPDELKRVIDEMK